MNKQSLHDVNSMCQDKPYHMTDEQIDMMRSKAVKAYQHEQEKPCKAEFMGVQLEMEGDYTLQHISHGKVYVMGIKATLTNGKVEVETYVDEELENG
jgi:hypothetical protein